MWRGQWAHRAAAALRRPHDASNGPGLVNVELNQTALLFDILNTEHFKNSMHETFVGLVFETRFNYERDPEQLKSYEEGYYQYILSRTPNNGTGPLFETIYMAGISRGGFLSMRLAERLVVQFPKTRTIIHCFDPVCQRYVEFNVNGPAVDNPLKDKADGYKFWTTDIFAHFKDKTDCTGSTDRSKCLSIRSFVAGMNVLDIAREQNVTVPKDLHVHAFGHNVKEVSKLPTTLSCNGLTYYKQSWAVESHDKITFYHHEEAVDHFNLAMKELPSDCRCN